MPLHCTDPSHLKQSQPTHLVIAPTAQTPTLADIKVAIIAEAKRRGIEGQIRPDAPSNPRAGMFLFRQSPDAE